MARLALPWMLFSLCLTLTASCMREQSPSRPSRRGESCASRNDCTSGLTCVRSICVLDEIPIAVTANECAIVECAVASDCSAYPKGFLSTWCPVWKADCDAVPSSAACNDYTSRCAGFVIACEDGTCTHQHPCTTDTDCPLGSVCSSAPGSICVECVDDTDCTASEYCDASTCHARCTSDGDCPLSGKTIYVCDTSRGACRASPCTDDRECEVLLADATAKCTSGSCSVSCDSDAQCGTTNGSWERCVSGVCAYVGCATNLECSIALRGEISGTEQAICRPVSP